MLLLNTAAIKVASRLGGLRYFYPFLTVAAQVQYTLPNTIVKLESPAWVVDNVGLSNEESEPFDIYNFQDFQALKNADSLPDQCGWYEEENGNILHLEPPFADANRTIRVIAKGFPNELTNSTTLYDGDISQMRPICLLAAADAKLRSRDYNEAKTLSGMADEAIEDVARMESIKNQVDCTRSGQVTPAKALKDF
jgi:hypothetical protein